MSEEPNAGPRPEGEPPSGPGAPEVPGLGGPKKGFAAVLGDIREILNNVYGIVTVIGALVASFAGGAAVGHVVTPTPTVAASPPTSPALSPTVAPSVTPTPSVTPPSTPPPSLPVTPSGTTGGQLLGSYTVKLPPGYKVPLGASPPKQSDFTPNSGGALFSNGHENFSGGDSKMLQATPGATPTYQGCAADTEFIGSQPIFAGAAFCYIEPGLMLGITVSSVVTTPAPFEVLNVTVWSN
ncbi:hypothetical protein CFP65_5992 [Kitasatospora sp. MMS16-BH015]|uniref:hypothetical protein n=1 Tax=Kitasatospora sp. MMS16-BH015 TaxID=2018025 RepID=UPI000CA245A6|nr:hypothetical protein [Kitasatospora sp. MMS16-BH015]AUG80666.1 hypothetical protein CFP65_5992 [Kitasatospora sp. MMS16-BH015]